MLGTFIAFAASLVLSVLTRPSPPNAAASDVSQTSFPVAEADRPIPVLFGTRLITGANCVWYGDARTERIRVSTGGLFSSGHQTVGHRYFYGFHLVLAAEIDALIEIRANDKTAWAADDNGGEITRNQKFRVEARDLFGGEKKGGGLEGDVTAQFGGADQPVHYYLAREQPGPVPAYRGVAALVVDDMYIGTDRRWEPWAVRCRRIPDWYADTARIGDDANPAHVLRELIVNHSYGLGYSAADVDDAAFRAAADTLYAEHRGISLLWTEQSTVADFMAKVADHVDANVYVDVRTGRFAINLARGDTHADTAVHLDESTTLDVERFSRQGRDDLTNQVALVYQDAKANAPKTVTVQDIAAQANQGQVVATTLQRPGFSRAALANQAAQRALKQLSTATAKVSLTANRKASGLQIGEVFIWSYAPLGIKNLPMRVASIDYGALADGQIRIQAGEDVFGDAATLYAPPPPSAWQDPRRPPAPAPVRSLREATYRDIIDTIAGAPNWAEIDKTSGFLVTLATKPSGDALDYTLSARAAGTAYRDIDDQGFTPSATLAAAIGPADTAIGFASTADLAAAATAQPQIAYLGTELVQVRTLQSNQCTLDRGLLDTVPAEHPAGARLWLYADGARGIDDRPYGDGDTVDAKLLPVTSRGPLEPTDAPVDRLQMNHRAIRPLPPGRIRLNAAADPAYITGALAVTWAHRNRLDQLGPGYVTQDQGDQGHEPGTTYTVKIYDENGALIHTDAGLAGTATNYPIASEIADSSLTNTVLTEDFASAELALDLTGDWQRSQKRAYTGDYALASPAIGDRGRAAETLAFTLETAGAVAFVYRVSSESSYDNLTVTLDGERVVRASGETGWQPYTSARLAAGAHRLEWVYAKGSSVSEGDDAAYIDDLRLLLAADRPNETLRVTVNAHRDGYQSWQAQDRTVPECRGFGMFFGAYFGE